VDVVSAAFEGKGAVQRHRMVYQLLQAEIDAGVHALALKTKTPAEVGQK
jgi:BolA protein